MTNDEQQEMIEKLRYEIDLLKAKSDQDVPEIEEDEGEEAPPVEDDDPVRDDPKGDLAATASALRSEVARMREIQELQTEKMDQMAKLFKRQGYKL